MFSKGSPCQPRRRNILRLMIDILIWLTVALPVLYLYVHGKPNEIGFQCDDPALDYPYKPEKLSTPALLVVGFSLSIIVVVLTEVLNCTNPKYRHHCINYEIVVYNLKNCAAFLLGFILQQFVIEVIKKRTGALRPNFFDVCKPQFNRTSCPGYITEYTCTGSNEKEVRDSRLAFPSGHSSFAMYIAVYLCLYMEHRLHLKFSHILKLVLQSGLIFVAILCGVDRVMDHKHHVSDVIVGFLLGIIVAIAVYNCVTRKVLNITNRSTDKGEIKPALQTTHNRSLCCMCESDTTEQEPQTPQPLLDHEFLDSSNNRLNTSTITTGRIENSPFFVRRHYSTPITPSRSEDLV